MRERIILLTATSTIGGALLGLLAGEVIFPPLAPIGCFPGAVLGLFSSAILVVTLGRKRLDVALPIVISVTVLAALASTTLGSLGAVILLSVAGCWLTCLVASLVLEDVVLQYPDGHCQTCGYDLTENESGVCPECGADVPTTDESSDRDQPVLKEWITRRSTPIRAMIISGAFLSVPIILVLLALPVWLARRTPVEVPALIERLGRNDVEVVYKAGQALLKHGPDPLIEALKHHNPVIRGEAADLLGVLGDRKAVPHMIAALADTNSLTRSDVAYALGKVGDPSVIPVLCNALKDPSVHVRMSAIKGLQLLEARTACPEIIALLKDPSPDVIRSAISALGELGDESEIPLLAPFVHDTRSTIADVAVLAIARLSEAPLDQYGDIVSTSHVDRAWLWWKETGAAKFKSDECRRVGPSDPPS